MPKFGKEMRENEFTLKEGVTFINHGGYGAVPRRVQEAQKRMMDEMNSFPDLWFRRNLRLTRDEAGKCIAEIRSSNTDDLISVQKETTDLMLLGNRRQKQEEARKCVAEFVNSDPDDLVFVQNATTGVNSVLKSLKLEPGDIILCTDNSYNAVKNTCENIGQVTSQKDVRTDYLALKFPIKTEDEVIEMYREYFKTNPTVRIAVMDHITSPSAIRMPIEKLIPLCREFGVLSMIDGAHAPGHIPLNIRELDADFYAGNLHKWLYAPRGCALLYVKKEHQGWVKPVVTSHGHKTSFQHDFFCQGTRDETPFCVAPEAIKFYNAIGGYEVIREYLDDLLCKATDLLTSSWKTEKLPIPKSMEAPFMRMIQVPKLEGLSTIADGERRIIENMLNHGIICTLSYVGGKVYCRISANIYNTEEDYQKLCQLILNQMEKNK